MTDQEESQEPRAENQENYSLIHSLANTHSLISFRLHTRTFAYLHIQKHSLIGYHSLTHSLIVFTLSLNYLLPHHHYAPTRLDNHIGGAVFAYGQVFSTSYPIAAISINLGGFAG